MLPSLTTGPRLSTVPVRTPPGLRARARAERDGWTTRIPHSDGRRKARDHDKEGFREPEHALTEADASDALGA